MVDVSLRPEGADGPAPAEGEHVTACSQLIAVPGARPWQLFAHLGASTPAYERMLPLLLTPLLHRAVAKAALRNPLVDVQAGWEHAGEVCPEDAERLHPNCAAGGVHGADVHVYVTRDPSPWLPLCPAAHVCALAPVGSAVLAVTATGDLWCMRAPDCTPALPPLSRLCDDGRGSRLDAAPAATSAATVDAAAAPSVVEPQEAFAQRFRRYFHLLTQGCGDPHCACLHCASNAGTRFARACPSVLCCCPS